MGQRGDVQKAKIVLFIGLSSVVAIAVVVVGWLKRAQDSSFYALFPFWLNWAEAERAQRGDGDLATSRETASGVLSGSSVAFQARSSACTPPECVAHSPFCARGTPRC